MMPTWFNMTKNDKKVGRIEIFGDILESGWEWFDSDVSPARFANALKDLGELELIELFINSPGGHVYAGISIGNILKAHPAPVVGHVVGIAGSIASVLLQACDERRMWSNTAQFVHAPLASVTGNAVEMRRIADDLDKVQVQIVDSYMQKVNIKEEKLLEIMAAESLLSAQECVTMGFADTIDSQSAKVSASDAKHLSVNGIGFDFSRFKNVSTDCLKRSEDAKVEPVDYTKWEQELINNEHRVYWAQITSTEKEIV